MSVPLLIFWGAVGWCGTPWPRWWKNPPPPPDPWWIIGQVIGIVGAIVGGWLFTQAWAASDALSVLASGAGALAGAIIASDITGLVMPKTRQAASS